MLNEKRITGQVLVKMSCLICYIIYSKYIVSMTSRIVHAERNYNIEIMPRCRKILLSISFITFYVLYGRYFLQGDFSCKRKGKLNGWTIRSSYLLREIWRKHFLAKWFWKQSFFYVSKIYVDTVYVDAYESWLFLLILPEW